MSFLAPLFLLGALAVALPVAFHLIRRSSREFLPFSSLMFLRPTPPRVTKRSRLEHLLLLLLRCLIIGLLALGFARPFIEKITPSNPVAETSHKIILLVDTSASMKRDGLWAAALARADEVLRKASPADQVAIFTFDNHTHSLINFDQWSAMNPSERAALALARVTELKPGWASTHLGNALTTAAETFTEADRQKQNLGSRRIVLVTDLQEGSRLDGLQGYDWPRGVEVQIETVQPRRPTNAGLQWVMDGDNSMKTGTNTGPRIRVSNSSNAQREQFQLGWDNVAGAQPIGIYVPPGQNRIVQAPQLPAGTVGERLVLTGDDDDFDNAVYVLQAKPERINVLFLGAENETNSSELLYYLKRAFQETRSQMVELNAHRDAASLSSTELANARLLITSGQLPADQIGAAQTFLSHGGTILFVMKDSTSADTLAKLAAVDALSAEEVTATNYAMLGLIDFQHPLFASFADPRYNDFTKIHFWKYRKVDADRIPRARVLARFDSGDPALLEIPSGPGRLLVLTSGWQPADSQFALSSKFVPLLYSMLDLAGGLQSTATQFHIGDQVSLASLSAAATTAFNVRKPDGAQVQLATGESTFSQTDTPGIYTVTSVEPPFRFVVNLDAAESRTAPLPIDQFEHLGVPLKPREIDTTQQVVQQRHLRDTELENRQKLWRWLTLAALVVLLGETWLAGWLTRRNAFKTKAAT